MKDLLRATFQRLLEAVQTKTHRYLYDQFNISNRLTGLIGPRGVGKTTLMLQYIKEHLLANDKVFYFSADHIYFNSVSILEFVGELYQLDGIDTFFIDEIHKYANWNQELKNIYDGFPSIKIVFSGSSSIDIVKGSYDLSRRAKLFHLHGMSFREYLNFSHHTAFEPISFDTLIEDYQAYSIKLATIPKVLGCFRDYLAYGYYPFVFEDRLSYYDKILMVIEKTINEDIANFYNLKTPNLVLFKKILNFLATIPPGQVSTHKLAQNLKIDDKTVANYVMILQEAGLVRLVYVNAGGSKLLRKPEKMFINNTTLLTALNSYLAPNAVEGTVRELFFLQSLADSGVDVYYGGRGDFLVNDVIFEIGGKNKDFAQLHGVSERAFLVKDGITVAGKDVIPLLCFGFLY